MSINGEGDNRGASITPSARRSIHSHRNSSSSCTEAMVRYGLNKKSTREASTGPSSEGTDEVDNAFSKFSYTISDLPIIQGQKRRNSLNTHNLSEVQSSDDNDSETEDDSHSVLSKSLPATLPSHSPYRNASGGWQNVVYNSSVKSYTEATHDDSTSIINESSNSLHYNSLNLQDRATPKNNKKAFTLMIPVIVIALGLIYPFKSIFNASEVYTSIYYDETKFYKDMNNLGAKYKISEDSILRVKSGISSVSEKKDTSSFIFVYDSQSDKFNYNFFNMFIDEISYTAAKYLRNDSTSVRHLSIDGSKLDMKTHGDLITKYRDEVTKTGVMLVKHMDKVPSDLAMAFHYYCDEYDPLATKSAIFFTLNMAECYSNTDQKSTHSNIEKCLAKKWYAVPQNNIGPLLTRVVNIVVDVTNIF